MLLYWRLLGILLVLNLNLVHPQDGETSTSNPDSYRTGRLNQFVGYYTPRPMTQNIQRLYASIWAGWSSWSFCVNNAQIRVRACNTVRGFSCLGPNKETKECASPRTDNGRPNNISDDYDTVDDPYEEDRKIAMRQLYSDYDHNENASKLAKQKLEKLRRPIMSGVKNSPTEPIRINLPNVQNMPNRADGSPGVRPELLYRGNVNQIQTTTETTTLAAIETEQSTVEATVEVTTTTEPTTTTEYHPIQVTKFTTRRPHVVQPIRAFTNSPQHHFHQYRTTVAEPTFSRKGNYESKLLKVQKVYPTTASPAVEDIIADPIPTKDTAGRDIIESFEFNTNPRNNVPIKIPMSHHIPAEATATPTTAFHSQTTTVQSPTTSKYVMMPTETPIPASPPATFIREGETRGLGIRKLLISKNAPSPLIKNRVDSDAGTPFFVHDSDAGKAQEEDTAKALEFMVANMARAVKKINVQTEPNENVKNYREESDTDLLMTKSYKEMPEIRRKPANHDSTFQKVVKTNENDYEDLDEETKKLLMGAIQDEKTLNDPVAIQREIEKLKNLMKDVEGEMVESDGTTSAPHHNKFKITEHQLQRDTSYRPEMSQNAKDLALVPSESGFVVQENLPLPAIITQDAESRGQGFVPQAGELKRAQWSDWGDWNECFCLRQLRTRSCIYDSAYHSSGCVGSSYESRDCVTTRPCPALETKKLLAASSSSDVKRESIGGLRINRISHSTRMSK
uniref:Mucin-5AC n=1 Tax=Rhabditophanes sp. KR3021 TaxID=114890 RepID=A0AC35UBD6_9BILA